MQTGDIIMPTHAYNALIAALASAATTHMPDLAELVDLDALKIALGERAGIFPAQILRASEVGA